MSKELSVKRQLDMSMRKENAHIRRDHAVFFHSLLLGRGQQEMYGDLME